MFYLLWKDFNGWFGLLTTMKRSRLNRSILQNALILLVWINNLSIPALKVAGVPMDYLYEYLQSLFFFPNSKCQSCLASGLVLHTYRAPQSWECWDTCWFWPKLATQSTMNISKDYLVTVLGCGMLPAKFHS